MQTEKENFIAHHEELDRVLRDRYSEFTNVFVREYDVVERGREGLWIFLVDLAIQLLGVLRSWLKESRHRTRSGGQ